MTDVAENLHERIREVWRSGRTPALIAVSDIGTPGQIEEDPLEAAFVDELVQANVVPPAAGDELVEFIVHPDDWPEVLHHAFDFATLSPGTGREYLYGLPIDYGDSGARGLLILRPRPASIQQ